MKEENIKSPNNNSEVYSNRIVYGTDHATYSSKHLIIIGANGSGKSSLVKSMKVNISESDIISAHKNLLIKQGMFRASKESELLNTQFTHIDRDVIGRSMMLSYGNQDPSSYSYNNFIQNDFNQSIELIFRQYTDESIKIANKEKSHDEMNRKLDLVMKKWNEIFINKKLLYNNKKIQVKSGESYYDIECLSDGERSVLYLLIKVILSRFDSIIIDEPELYLNTSLLNQLIDSIESVKANCSFIYFTHDLSFATSRPNASLFWIKSYIYPSKWVLCEIQNNSIPDELIVKIIGSKKEKVLFVESVENKDSVLYQKLYSEFTVISVQNVKNVINYTKALNSNHNERFNKSYFGLIDRDLRADDEVSKLKQDKIFCIPTAIYENLFLMGDLVLFILNHDGDTDLNSKLEKLKENVKEKVNSTNFQSKYIKNKLKKKFSSDLDSVEDINVFNFQPDIEKYKNEIEDLKSKNYEEILKYFNQKDLKGCVQALGLNWDGWHRRVINIFNTEKQSELKEIFFKFMPKLDSVYDEK